MLKLIDQDDRRTLQPIASAVGHDFLQSQLKRVRLKISNQEDYLERYFTSEEDSRNGVVQMLEVYAQEKDIIMALIQDCQEDILPDVFYRRLSEIERALAAARVNGLPSIHSESGYWQLRREAEILKDLLRKWNQSFRNSTQEGQD